MTIKQLEMHTVQWTNCLHACNQLKDQVAGTQQADFLAALTEASSVILALLNEVRRLRMETCGSDIENG